jgi:hypothetical protein
MKSFRPGLAVWLRVAATIQLLMAMVYWLLPRTSELFESFRHFPKAALELFAMHCQLLAFVVGASAVLTWRFASELAVGANAVTQWLTGAIGLFWGFRACSQLYHFAVGQWETRSFHLIICAVYGGLALVYLAATMCPVDSSSDCRS